MLTPKLIDSLAVMTLIIAAKNGSLPEVINLLDAGFNPNLGSFWNYTPLMAAAEGGNEDIVQTLLRAGANANAITLYGANALMFAAMCGHTNCVSILADHTYLNAQTSFGMSALMHSAIGGHADCVEFLLNAGAISSLTNGSGATALLLAERKNHRNCIALLVLDTSPIEHS